MNSHTVREARSFEVSDGRGNGEPDRSSDTTRKVRYVLGLFSVAGHIGRALTALADEGMPLGQLKLLAPPDGPQAGQVTWGGIALPVIPEDAFLADFRSSGLGRHALLLHRHLRAGGGILVVKSMTDAEERTASTTLLRHADAGVQIHEISPPRITNWDSQRADGCNVAVVPDQGSG